MDKKQWFRERKWGVFLHYLSQVQNNPDMVNSGGRSTTWDECVNELDTDMIAEQLHEVNAGYLVFTLTQGRRYLAAPNEVFEKLSGLKPGEGCCRRDVIGDLIRSLAKYDIPLFLYYTGDGPSKDEYLCGIFGTPSANKWLASPSFVQKWTDVLREYSLRYGDSIKGWWIDGMYSHMYPRTDNPNIGLFKEAALAGNPDALFSANYYGVCRRVKEVDIPGFGNVIFGEFYHEIQPPTKFCDYTAGEANSLDLFPSGPEMEGAVPHALSFLGIPKPAVKVYKGWGAPGTKYSPAYLRGYVDCVNTIGGVVSIDCCLYRSGRIDTEQMETLRALKSIKR